MSREFVDLVRQSSGKWKNSDLAFFVLSSRKNTEIEARLVYIRHGFFYTNLGWSIPTRSLTTFYKNRCSYNPIHFIWGTRDPGQSNTILNSLSRGYILCKRTSDRLLPITRWLSAWNAFIMFGGGEKAHPFHLVTHPLLEPESIMQWLHLINILGLDEVREC